MEEKDNSDPIIMNELATVSPELYRDAMSHFASAVHVITTKGIIGLRGATVSACCSLSDNPPTLLVCIMKQHEDNQMFVGNGHFCVNTLAGEHHSLADVFAGRRGLSGEERFAHAQWTEMKTGSPVLENALAAFDCRLVGWHEHETHCILFGQVVGICCSEEKDALIYLNRDYHRLKL